MSDADQEAVTVSADGITVRKTVDAEQFQTLAVVIELASEREDGARVQVVDAVPSGIPMDDVGFHPDYGAEHWSVDDGTVAFERDLDSGEAYTTIYGIRDYPKDEIEALLGEPEVGLVDTGSDDLDAVIDEGRSDAVREFISGEADLPGLEDEITAKADAAEVADPVEEATGSEAPATSEAAEAEGTAAETAAETPAEPETAAAGASQAGRRPPAGGVVRVLIKELREGDIDDEDRRLLRDELLDVEGTTETRVGHLQQRVSDLEAYTDALEAFIDEEGTAEQVITDLRDDVAGLEREVRSAGDRLDEAIDGLDTVEDRIDAVGDDVGTVRSRAAQLDERLEDAEDDIAGVDRRADDIDARLDGLSANVDSVDDRVSDVDERVEDVRDELNTLRRNLRNDIEALEADLEDFEEFRDRLSSVFGGPGGPGGSADQGDGG